MRPLILLALFAIACSSGGGNGNSGPGTATGKLTCAWLAGPENCWQKAVDEAYTDCAVPAEGYFGDEYLSCTYPNGDSDVYGSAGRELDGGGNGHDNFYVEAKRGGATCFTFEAPTPTASGAPESWSLTTKSGKVTYSNLPDGMSIQCPNGSTFTATGLDVITVLSCPMKQFPDGSSGIPLPGFFFSEANFSVFPPANTPTDDDLTKCTCAPQEYDGGGVPPPEPGCPAI